MNEQIYITSLQQNYYLYSCRKMSVNFSVTIMFNRFLFKYYQITLPTFRHFTKKSRQQKEENLQV